MVCMDVAWAAMAWQGLAEQGQRWGWQWNSLAKQRQSTDSASNGKEKRNGMANRRMFSIDIIDTDDFLAMPATARLLYYDMSMRADDEGFVGSAKKIMTFTGAK